MKPPEIVPLAWKDRQSLIEVAFPGQKVSIEAQTERKANAGQTLTALGSYWKGRKPLVLVRACILGALLPATDDPEKDLEILELLLAMDDDAFERRVKAVSKEDVETWGGPLKPQLLDGDGAWKVKGEERRRLLGRVLARIPYVERLNRRSIRSEELPDAAYESIWPRVNGHLGTSARTHAELVEQIGILRFGHRPRAADTFCGGGSIPFEAARLGCDAYASDLNPIACMLTWGAFHLVGANPDARVQIANDQAELLAEIDGEMKYFGLEHDESGNRAKSYLYCLEVRCPESGWLVPLLPSLVVSWSRKCVAVLVPDRKAKQFRIEIREGASDHELEKAERGGTVRNGEVVYTLDGKEYRTPIKTLRGDRRVSGQTINNLRRWEIEDIVPRPGDVFQERLYCIQWTKGDDARDAFFRSVTEDDLRREAKALRIVKKNLSSWQDEGLVPRMAIEPGAKTDEPIRTRGWTYWHHLFTPRELLVLSVVKKKVRTGADYILLASLLNQSSRLCRWLTAPTGKAGGPRDLPADVFYNQALNTFFNYATRSWAFHRRVVSSKSYSHRPLSHVATAVHTLPASDIDVFHDMYVTDPPYADAIRYEEITDFFISWLRQSPPKEFSDWIWDSRRDVAITGSGEDFRREMVKAYTAMAAHMPDNGLQVVMFTHQDARVWADMAGIFWGAGLQVTAAWYIATETTSELKKGGYVQGTVIMVLRKRRGGEQAYKDEVVLEIRQEVARQIETMVGLNQRTQAHGRSENLFEDSDLQMAGYAAALRILTGYTQIDGQDMTREAVRPRASGETSVVDELIEFAVAIANEHLVPEGLHALVWERLTGSERFYLRMLDVERAGAKKLDNYQNFAKAFRVPSWQPLMASMRPNESRLKSAVELKRTEFTGSEFGGSMLRAVLYALFELQSDVEPDDVMSHLRDNVKDYLRRRNEIAAVADYIARSVEPSRPEEASAARILHGLVRNERLS